MKTILCFVLAVLILASCSAPKYTYKFDYHDYNAGRKQKEARKEVAANPGPVAIQPEMLVAEAPATTSAESSQTQVGIAKQKAAPLTLSKSERKEMIKNVKAVVKNVVAMKKKGDVVETGQATKAMDADLKMALVFLVLSILFGALVPVVELLWIVSVAAFVVALIFFIKWLMRQ